MADIVDQADVQVEYALKNALLQKKPEPSKKYTGYCWLCESPVEPPKRWCDAECRDKWEQENA